MKTKRHFLLAVIAIFVSMGFTFAQSPVAIVLHGQLINMEKTPLAEKDGILDFTIKNKDEASLCEYTFTFTTDEGGMFTIFITEMVDIFTATSSREIADLLIDIYPAEGEDWLPDGKYKVKYHLEKVMADEYKMTRYEGQTLNYSYRLPVWQFTDIYPLGYLKSSFIISFGEDVADPEKLIAIGKEMGGGLGETEEAEAAPKRGVKGGYAIGGYNASKKKSDKKSEESDQKL